MIFLGFFSRSVPEPAPVPEPTLSPEDEARAERFHTWGVTR